MSEYRGMNFYEWCKLDRSDDRKINYKTPHGKFTSDDQINPNVVEIIRELYKKKADLVNNEWCVHLVKNKVSTIKV